LSAVAKDGEILAVNWALFVESDHGNASENACTFWCTFS